MVIANQPLGSLRHSGVKGMKWGVRKDAGHEGQRIRTKKLNKLDARYEKSFTGTSGFFKIHNEVAGEMNKRLDGLNAKYANTNMNLFNTTPANKKVNDAYLKDYEGVLEDSLKSSMSNFGTNASGTRRVKLKRVGEGVNAWYESSYEDIKHADGDFPRLKITPKINQQGRIVSQTVEELVDDIAHVMDPEAFLEHFGIKGMKWGQRKATPLPRNTRAVTVVKRAPAPKMAPLYSKKGRYQRDNADTAVTVVARPGQKVKTAGGSNRKASEDAIRAAAARRIAQSSTTDALSSKDLKALVERMNLEQQYAKLTTPNPTRVQKFINQVTGQVAQQQVSAVANGQAQAYLKKRGLIPSNNGSK